MPLQNPDLSPAGFNWGGRHTQVTPERRTIVEFDTNAVFRVRPSQTIRRAADQMHRDWRWTGAEAGEPVRLIPGPTWILNPFLGESIQMFKPEWSNAVQSGTKPTNFAQVATSRIPGSAELTGLGTVPGLIPIQGYQKQVPTGTAWDGAANSLGNDNDIFPKPPSPIPQLIPLDRVWVSSTIYPKNACFGILFRLHMTGQSPDAFLNFYFGGPAENVAFFPADLPGTPEGGTFCVQLRGNGKASLYEHSPASGGTGWAERMQFHWTQSARMNEGEHEIWFYPHSNDRLVIFCHNQTLGHGYAQNNTGGVWGSRPSTTRYAYFREAPPLTQHTHGDTMTGVGVARLDLRRDICHPFTIFRLKHPSLEVFDDAPVFFELGLPKDTPIALDAEKEEFGSTVLTAKLHSVVTGNELAPGPAPGTFLSREGEQYYFARFTFTSDADRWYSPLLFGYSVSAELEARVKKPAVFKGGNLRRVSITGSGLSPEEETASVVIKDPRFELQRLTVRGRFGCRIQCITKEDPRGYTTLFAGRTMPCEARKRGRIRSVGMAPNETGAFRSLFPSQFWNDFDPLRMVGNWAYLMEAPILEILDFRVDEDAPREPSGYKPGWRITDAITRVFRSVGYLPWELDIPQNDLRLLGGGAVKSDDLVIQVNTAAGTVIQRLALMGLGQAILFDPNAAHPDTPPDALPAEGMWRLIPNPPPESNNFLAEFRMEAPQERGPRHRLQVGAYGKTSVTWIEEGSYRTTVNPPEFNYLTMTATGYLYPGDDGEERLVRTWHNRRSYDPGDGLAPDVIPDPNHPDFLGYCLRVCIIEPFLKDIKNLDLWMRRLADFAGHAEEMVSWRSPLLLVHDPTDPFLRTGGVFRYRPLRFNDLVYIRGRKATIRNVNPDYTSSKLMMADYTAKFVSTFSQWPYPEPL